MKKNKLNKRILQSFELDNSGKFVGGFSPALNDSAVTVVNSTNKDCITTNNCNGANCRLGCGNQ